MSNGIQTVENPREVFTAEMTSRGYQSPTAIRNVVEYAISRLVRGDDPAAVQQDLESRQVYRDNKQTIDAILAGWKRAVPNQDIALADLSVQQVHDMFRYVRGPAAVPEERGATARAPEAATQQTFAYDIELDGVACRVTVTSEFARENKQRQLRDALRDPATIVTTPSGESMDRVAFSRQYTLAYNEWQQDSSTHTIRVTRAFE